MERAEEHVEQGHFFSWSFVPRFPVRLPFFHGLRWISLAPFDDSVKKRTKEVVPRDFGTIGAVELLN